MSDVVNLRLARKAKQRADSAAKAAVNRAAFGRTAQDKAAAIADTARIARTLDGARRGE